MKEVNRKSKFQNRKLTWVDTKTRNLKISKNIEMKEINSSEFEQEVLNGGKVVLDFYSTE